MKLQYTGLLCHHSWGDADDILFLSSEPDPLAEVLDSSIAHKHVTVHYWITDQECTRDEAQDQFLRKLCGVANIDFVSHYSEMTGYLWTDESVQIGGHNLISELSSHIGKWLILEIEIHSEE